MTDTWTFRRSGTYRVAAEDWVWRRKPKPEAAVLEGVAVVEPALLAPSAVLELAGCRPGPFVTWPAPPEIGPAPDWYVYRETPADEDGSWWSDSLPLSAWIIEQRQWVSDYLDRCLREAAYGPDIVVHEKRPEPDVMIVHDGPLTYVHGEGEEPGAIDWEAGLPLAIDTAAIVAPRRYYLNDEITGGPDHA